MTSIDTNPAFTLRASGDEQIPAYPIALRLRGKGCLVVGGGRVAARKVRSLVAAGAQVRVVAPDLCAELARLLAAGAEWEWEQRPFVAADVRGCLLAVAATDDPVVNAQVAAAAREHGALANVIDDPEAGDFHVPSVAQRGPLQVAVSTSGLAPALAVSLRRRFEALLPEEMGSAVAMLGRARRRAREGGLDETQRKRLARELAGLDIERLLVEGGLPKVETAIGSCISRYLA